ncbi:MAG TPA: glucose 1-dehydrogenase [Candidatus Binataceae bacterium]|nr:glucose 1-dehydrogenase [Candidatus Binataceae bacterium]
MGRLDGKVAVITGAASGIGRGTAVRFAGEGAAVVIADLNEEGGAAAVRECKENGGRAVFQQTDVTSEAAVKAMVDRAVREFGRLDITFNNAGLGGALGSIEQTTVEDWDRTFAVLTRGVFLGIKHSVAEMRKAGGGSIISTASVAGLAGGYGPHAYSAAKSGVVNLTRSVALELAKDRIRVNCICPGGINTPIFNFLTSDREMTAQLLAPMHPMRRAGTPDDIANMALFLASDEAEWITGVAMVVDGGLTAGRDIFGDVQTGGMYTGSAYIGPSFEIKR